MGLKQAYKAMITAHGFSRMAHELDMTETALDNRMYERKGQSFSVRDSLAMQTISGTTHFAEAIAELSGGTFVKLPEAEDCNEEMSSMFMELTIELGQLSAAYVEAKRDGEIDKKEKASILKIQNDILRTTQTLTALMFRVHCREGV